MSRWFSLHALRFPTARQSRVIRPKSARRVPRFSKLRRELSPLQEKVMRQPYFGCETEAAKEIGTYRKIKQP